jgi:hypothetical protein
MKRLLSIFLVIAVVLAAAPVLAASAPISVDLFPHHLSIASIAVTAPAALSWTLNEWLALRKYSRAQWYRMPPDERPELIGKGRMQRITFQADARWLRKQERRAKTESRAA